jgi:hypothetical protein
LVRPWLSELEVTPDAHFAAEEDGLDAVSGAQGAERLLKVVADPSGALTDGTVAAFLGLSDEKVEVHLRVSFHKQPQIAREFFGGQGKSFLGRDDNVALPECEPNRHIIGAFSFGSERRRESRKQGEAFAV